MLTFRDDSNGALRLRLPAIIDISMAEDFQQECIAVASRGKDIVIEADETERLSTAFFQILIALNTEAQRSNGSLSIQSPSSYFSECLTFLGLTSYLTVRRSPS